MTTKKILKNKKAAEFTIGTLIFIVLGVIVLVILVLGFTMGWGNLWTTIKNYFSAGDMKSVVQACEIAATVENSYDFCLKLRDAKFGDKMERVTCLDPRLRTQLGDKVLSCNFEQLKASVEDICTKEVDKASKDKKGEVCTKTIFYFSDEERTCNKILTNCGNAAGNTKECWKLSGDQKSCAKRVIEKNGQCASDEDELQSTCEQKIVA